MPDPQPPPVGEVGLPIRDVVYRGPSKEEGTLRVQHDRICFEGDDLRRTWKLNAISVDRPGGSRRKLMIRGKVRQHDIPLDG